jgi:predicted O-linked N-acetylglucosamine transferase (SPINDLY family)
MELGLAELVTASLPAYAQRAVELLLRADVRDMLRQRLRQSRLTSPAFDTDLQVRADPVWCCFMR